MKGLGKAADEARAVKRLKVLAMIPTFNERENVALLIEEILALSDDFGVLVVDDDSPDGTAEAVLRLAEREPDRVFLLLRKEKRGRGYAGIAGFIEATRRDPEFVVEMDADFSHRPSYIPQFLGAIGDADIVIGSRGVSGGAQVGRSLARKIITRLANGYIVAVLGIYGHDLTSGFRLFRTSALKRLALDKMISTGPEVVQEVLCLAQQQGLKIAEHPIVFWDRSAGQSTFSWRIALHSLAWMWRFRFKYARGS